MTSIRQTLSPKPKTPNTYEQLKGQLQRRLHARIGRLVSESFRLTSLGLRALCFGSGPSTLNPKALNEIVNAKPLDQPLSPAA